ncbi:AbrB family transcriptional regulator [Pararhizobium sp.]|uniref:AbrB family transcriptional regulator n=1 Tax=Pararhizobium sp. TaxID=1977563 RepID=UPI0027270454|nr:AbrB family transcriptional regulator [Pararhizobium sp.]MDO9418772.1 AbrB family transcriptional regulator [Pararhizobium sp.]
MKPEPPDLSPAPLASGLGRWHPLFQWTLLIAVSLALALTLEFVGLPAAFLMGPMLAAAIVAMNGANIRLARPPYFAAQALIGIMVAGAIEPGILKTFVSNWPLFLAVVLSVIAMSSLSGWTLSRLGILPGTTAIWGTSAGGATSMLLMADAYGADTRLVAFMQYLRVVFVAAAASVVAHIWVGNTASGAPVEWFAAIDLTAFAKTLAVAIAGALAGKVLRITAGIFLVPFILGTVLTASGHLTIVLPHALLALAYALLGWNIGLGFTRPILAHARLALLPIVVSILVLMAFSGFLAFLLTQFAGVDALTAYLATSPGGMDSIAIIAASSHVDISFVMALQTARLLLIMACGPSLARFMASKTGGKDKKNKSTE